LSGPRNEETGLDIKKHIYDEGGMAMKATTMKKRAKNMDRKTLKGWIDPMSTPIDTTGGF
jgi:hypothetical protein